MLSLKRPVWVALMTACLAAGQPALTTIQDTLYKADGTRFTGTVYINYSSFQADSASTTHWVFVPALPLAQPSAPLLAS